MTPDDWIPGPDASKIYGLPIELIAEGLVNGHVRIDLLDGAPVVNRSDVAALALRLKEGGCVSCD